MLLLFASIGALPAADSKADADCELDSALGPGDDIVTWYAVGVDPARIVEVAALSDVTGEVSKYGSE